MEPHTVFVSKIIVFFLVIVGYIGYKFYKNRKKNKEFFFPPWPAQCPDLWEVVKKDGKIACKNVNKIGNCANTDSDNIYDFTNPIFKQKDSAYYKCKWATQCNVSWEGIDKLCI